jgi:hypothetical protein
MTARVQAACGQCLFDLPGDGCDLAVRIRGEAWFVDGAHIDDHGDAHGTDGMCNTIREAEVVGSVDNGRFRVESFRLI